MIIPIRARSAGRGPSIRRSSSVVTAVMIVSPH
jgi:hypothetical protein